MLAPSVIGDALPAVTVPSSVKLVFKLLKASMLVSGRTFSSWSIFRSSSMMTRTSSSNLPSFQALVAFWWEARLNSSWSRLETWSRLATFSAVMPIGFLLKASIKPSFIIRSFGRLVMDSLPPTATRPRSPIAIWAWARRTAFKLEPQTSLMLVATESWRIPAFKATCRAMFWPRPADKTLPIKRASRAVASRSASCRAPSKAISPNSMAEKSASCLW